MSFDPIILLLVLVALLLGVGLVLILRRSGGHGSGDDLNGRLAQMAESQAAMQAQLAERLNAQESLLTRAVDERLEAFSKRVGDRLQESASRQQTSLTELRERLAVIDRAQKNITELSSQVVGLQDILANKQARGAFGEVQLRDIVEAVLPPSTFDFQVTLSNGRRVDCLLRMPNPPGSIAVDAKFPLESYELLRAARDDTKTQAQRDFTTSIRKHVRDIAERYILPGETADSALMFLPSEAVYAELHANFRGVVEESYKARVWIVSPTTLMATLNTIRAVWKDVRMTEQAGIIQIEVAKMLEDVVRLDKRVDSLDRHFGQARKDIEEIRTSTLKINRRGERICELELDETDADPAPLPPQLRSIGGD